MSEVFICYSHEDRKYFEELLTHLKALKDRGLLNYWSDKEISTGERWRETIEVALGSAKVAILLGSRDFFASEFITKTELPLVLDAAKKGNLRIIYLPVGHCNYSHTEIAEYQAAYPPDRPLRGLSPAARDEAYVTTCNQVLAAVIAGRFANKDRVAPSQVHPSEDRQLPVIVVAEQPCLSSTTIAALVAGRASPEEITQAVGHFWRTPSSRQCGACLERIKDRFLDEADRSDPEVAAAIAVRDGTLRSSSCILSEVLSCEAAGLAETNTVVPVIHASFALRFEPDAPKLLSYASLAAMRADAAGDPFTQTIAHSWLARVRSIRGEFYEASREIGKALSLVKQLKGSQRTLARAFSLHQSADRRWRLRDFEKARNDFERAIHLYYHLNLPSTAQSVEFGLALSFSEAGQFVEARDLFRKILSTSRDRLLVTSTLQVLTGEVLPNMAREGNAGLAERALCLRAVVGEDKRPEKAIRARNLWSYGRLAWALGACEVAFAFYREASALFLSLAPAAGLYEDALIKLYMIEALQEYGSLEELQQLALQAADTFHKLGADNPRRLALGLAQHFQTRAEAIARFKQAREVLRLAEKRRLLRAARRLTTTNDMWPNTLAWY